MQMNSEKTCETERLAALIVSCFVMQGVSLEACAAAVLDAATCEEVSANAREILSALGRDLHAAHVIELAAARAH